VPPQRWTFLLQPRWLCWHTFVLAATAGMTWLGLWQLHRAESGNELSWAYTFEWPLFAGFALYFWVRSLRDELRPEASGSDLGPAGSGDTGTSEAGASIAAGGPREPEASAAYAARLRAEVHGHGRWHGWR
jgi:hypothetical protein